jgi:hypothetical protein
MPLLLKDGVLAAVGGALKNFVAGCIDSCCTRWYCHLPSYTCDKDEVDHISEHASQAACLKACGDGVEHYCHVGGDCDTDPNDAVATYPSKTACDEACGQWWCCYDSLDFTKGSECKEGPCDMPELIRAGPFESKEECEPDCEMQYYCVLADGADGTQPDHYMCVTDPAGMTILSGPQSEDECDATCSSRRPTIWCVDKKRCVLSFDGPPVECSFGAFCEEYASFIECGFECLKERWYCVPADNECMQLALPPTPGAVPYGSQADCEKECQSYYCCWVSQGDPTKGSYCQLGECDDGFEKSGPHDDEGICEADCHSIYCWSYYDTATGETVKTCAEDPPLGDCEPNYGCEGSQEVDGDTESENLMISYRSDGFDADRTNIGGTLWRVDYRCQRETAECEVNICLGPLRPDICTHENVTQLSGPYGREQDCNRICNPPVYKWFCENEVCVECCSGGTCKPTDRTCPESGNFTTEEDCKKSCGSPCYFCEDGTVTEDHLPADDCTGLGGFLDKADADKACKPPCGDCVPIPGITSLKLEVKDDQVCVLATAQWTPPDGCYESDQEARDKVSIQFEFLDKDRQVVQGIGGPANIGDNTVGYCNSVAGACNPASKKAEFVRAKAISQECESKWSPEKGLSAGSPTWEEVCEPPPPPVQCYCICVSEPAPGRCDAPGAYKSCQPVFYIDSLPEDERPEIVSGPFACDDCVAECIQPPPPPCEGQRFCDEWKPDYDADGNFVTCVRICCDYNADCGCIDGTTGPEFSPDQSLCPAAKENPLP